MCKLAINHSVPVAIFEIKCRNSQEMIIALTRIRAEEIEEM